MNLQLPEIVIYPDRKKTLYQERLQADGRRQLCEDLKFSFVIEPSVPSAKWVEDPQ
ncbi:hypothetical protein [Fischerella sp. JS2]|uniref:hypothetical protein n=1 Tax=Fischerella sp. JS2 TaxID=2597771 RepID=UPI0028EA7E0D|nr:hypothetical protein [Fischerella sp. JS2]